MIDKLHEKTGLKHYIYSDLNTGHHHGDSFEWTWSSEWRHEMSPEYLQHNLK